MSHRGGTKKRAIELLDACQSPIFELPPFYYLMEAEVHAQMQGKQLDRSGLVGRTQWEALRMLMVKLPGDRGVFCRPEHVSDEPLANWLFCKPIYEQFLPPWRNNILRIQQLPKGRGSQLENKEAFLTYFLDAEALLNEKIWTIPERDEVLAGVDVGKCPCICCHYNHFVALTNVNDPLEVNHFVDSHRVTEAPYVDIFTCDKQVKELIRQGAFMKAGGIACASPEEVVEALGA